MFNLRLTRHNETDSRGVQLPYIRRMLLVMMLFAVFCSSAAFTSPHAFAATMSSVRSHPSPQTQHIKKLSLSHVRPSSATSYIYPSWNFLGCGTGWNQATDTYLHYFKYAYTTGSRACSSAVWDDSGISFHHTCDVIVYIPTILATANISYGFYLDYGVVSRATINQNNVYGWTYLTTLENIRYVLISSNNGQNGTYMAAGEMGFTCY